MRAVRVLSSVAVAGALTLGASAAGAQTTTLPPVRSIPVTGGQAATTTTTARATTATTAPAPSSGTAGSTTAAPSNDSGLADTGMAADLLVPFALALIGGGAVLQVVARRRDAADYGLL